VTGDAADLTRSIYLGAWRVDLVRRAGVEQPVPASVLARHVVRALEASEAPSPAAVTVVLSDDTELAELNATHMGSEGPTDVLSFPMLPPERFRREGRGGRRRVRSAGGGETDEDQARGGRPGRTHIGDIAISVERAIEQAAQGRGGQTGDVSWSAGDELRLLVTHGTLHLCGWDHAEPEEEAAMRALEQRLLELGGARS
jgi:probable rRNA maturation factor